MKVAGAMDSNNSVYANDTEEKESSIHRSMLFYTAGSLGYYACQWALSIVIVWISGYEAAGILSIALTVCAAPAIVGLFNVRAFQVSDLKGEYNTGTYTSSRHVTNLLSFFVCICMIAAGKYNLEKTLVILVFMLYKIAEGTADVYYGIEQKRGRLDIAGISYALRGLGTLVPFVAVQVLTDRLLLSLIAITICSYGVIVLFDIPRCRKLDEDIRAGEKRRSSIQTVKSLLITCVPLAVVAFANNLSVNLPKIALENYYGSEVMGYFSSVTSPSMGVQLVAMTLFAPLVTPLALAFQQKRKKEFYGMMKKFLIILVVFSVVCVAAAACLGRFVLILIFGAGIEPYVYLFVPSIWMTILLAVCSCLFSVCTLVREIKLQYLIGGMGFLSSVVLALTVVERFSMMGVIYAQIGTIVVQMVIQLIIIVRRLKKAW